MVKIKFTVDTPLYKTGDVVDATAEQAEEIVAAGDAIYPDEGWRQKVFEFTEKHGIWVNKNAVGHIAARGDIFFKVLLNHLQEFAAESASQKVVNVDGQLVNLEKNKPDFDSISKVDNQEDNRIVLMSKFSPVPYAQRLMRDAHFIFDRYKRFWRYDDREGIWREDAEQFISNALRVRLLGEEQQKNQYVSEVVHFIRDSTYQPDFNPILPENLIPLQNCLYDIDTGKMYSYSPDYFVTSKLSLQFDANCQTCPAIDRFFTEVVGEHYKVILYELLAYCLYRAQPYQKLFFLIGAGRNGKSTFLELLRAFLGNENVSSVPPHDICGGDRFAMGQMWNKHANLSNDISYEMLKDINRVKEVTGGDTVTIRRMYKEGFPARIFAKQVYSTNQLPIVNDKTDAWYRRVYLIDFPNKFEKPDRLLINKLTTPQELLGLTYVVLGYLQKLRKRNFCFTIDINVEKLAEMYEDLSNPISKFLKECTEDSADSYIWKFEFEERFKEFLLSNKMRQWSNLEINAYMKQRYEEQKKDYKPFGLPEKRWWAWVGLKWASVQRVQSVHGFITPLIYIEGVLESVDAGRNSTLSSTKSENFRPTHLNEQRLGELCTGNEGGSRTSSGEKQASLTVCSVCKSPLESGKFVDLDGRFLCQSCVTVVENHVGWRGP